MTAGRILTVVLGGILLLAELPIRLLEYHHLLRTIEANSPHLYHLLVSPSVAVARWIVGLLMIGWVIYEYRKQRTNMRPAEPPAAPAFQAAALPQQTINFNPVIQNIQHAPPVGGRAEPAQPAHRPQPQAAPVRQGPNLIFLHTGIVSVTFDNTLNREFFYESRMQDRDDPRAVLACFRNEPAAGRAVLEGERVRAHIIYRNQAGAEIGLGFRACWLDEFGDMVDFPVGESHCAILILKRADGQLLKAWQRRARANDGMGDVLNFQLQHVNEAISTIEVRLIDDEHGLLLTRVFNFADENGQLRIVEQPVPA